MNSNVDTEQQSISPEEQRLRRMYGNMKPRGHLDRFRQAKGRKQYFDSGEYAMAQAGKGDAIDVGAMGRQHPSPESIPHPVTPVSANGSGPGSKIPGAVSTSGQHMSQGSQSAGSPIKETSFLSRETSADDMEDDTEEAKIQNEAQQQEDQQQQQQQPQLGDAAHQAADSLPIRT
jgi:hypothetical protein